MSRVRSGSLAEPIAGPLAPANQVGGVVPVVGGGGLPWGDAQPRLEVLTDSVGPRARREPAPLELFRPPGGERRPRRFLLVLGLNRREEVALFGVEPFEIQRSSGDRLKHTPLHSRLASCARARVPSLLPAIFQEAVLRPHFQKLGIPSDLEAHDPLVEGVTRLPEKGPTFIHAVCAGTATVYLRLKSSTDCLPSSGRHAPGTASGLR